LILRVAHNTGCEYEWRHHEHIAQLSGLSADEVERIREGAAAEGWSPRQALLLRAADELHADRRISDEVWAGLRPLLSDQQLIELCLLVGHYEMLAMTLNSLEVEPDAAPRGRPSRATRLVQAIMNRRQPRHG
jgi:alkylhydroperoxidase family enzyme